jgi:CRISPR/Cas system-associated exonuclease Cas4 (RecB family)
MMEKLASEDLARDEFLEACSLAFDEALCERPPVHPSDAEALKREFLRMMGTTYDMDPHNKVLSAEDEFVFDHPSGIRLHGYPDRVEEGPDGRFLVADFKSKRKIDHVQDDFSTCMQVVVYAWLCEQAGIDISGCEYRYTRKGKTVTCKYDYEMKEELNSFLTALRKSIETNDFPRVEDEKVNCKYCKMAEICRWQQDENGEEDESDD